jgi:hypothetical protein
MHRAYAVVLLVVVDGFWLLHCCPRVAVYAFRRHVFMLVRICVGTGAAVASHACTALQIGTVAWWFEIDAALVAAFVSGVLGSVQ